MRNERRQDPFRIAAAPRLGSRLTKAVALGAGVALLLTGLFLDGFMYVSMRDEMVEDLTIQARITADSSSAAVLFNDAGVAAQMLAGLQASPVIERASLRDLNGTRLAAYVASTAAPAAEDATKQTVDGHWFRGGRLHIRQAVREGTREVGSLGLVVTLDGLHRRMLSYVAITLLASALAFGLAFVLVIPIRRRIETAEERLDYLAYYDPVTSLPNRHAANEQISRLIETVGRSSEGFALLLLDLDDFKVVNDTLGHAAGDELLRALASRLTTFMRPNDVAFRFGGDEFVILSPRVTEEGELRLLGQAAMLAFDDAMIVGGHEIHIRGSVGMARFPLNANDAQGLLRAADAAMYAAKALGKNTYALFDPSMHNDSIRRLRLEADLREAIVRSELALVYQPLVDMRSRAICGVEALLRWQHPVLGAVSPVEFIPVAERSGLIVDIGQWVLHEACRQMKVWWDAGHREMFVAVNVSALQVRRGLYAQVDEALLRSGLPPGALEIEITEHSMVEDLASNVEQLERLRQRRVQVAVDDFGTGLSSLAYLKRLPIGKLKIDRAFVKDLPGSSDDAAITSAIISMAHSLGLLVVAEGVEDEQQHAFLAARQCDFGQGYLYSKPVPADVLSALLASPEPE
jgi:diguanylate cyclase (GGDEF)-like protein